MKRNSLIRGGIARGINSDAASLGNLNTLTLALSLRRERDYWVGAPSAGRGIIGLVLPPQGEGLLIDSVKLLTFNTI